MRLAVISAVGLVALTAIGLSVPNTTVSARNPARLVGVPFIVPGECQTFGSANWVTQNGKLVLQLKNAYNGTNNNSVGWEVYNSMPGSATRPSTSTTGPSGTYTFTISGLPTSGAILCCSLDDVNHYNCTEVTFLNGPSSSTTTSPGTSGPTNATVVAPPAADLGSNIVAVQFYVDLTPVGHPVTVNPTMTVTNFKLNGAPLLADSTFTDYQPNYSNNLGFCDEGI